jgi:hypothetical protein
MTSLVGMVGYCGSATIHMLNGKRQFQTDSRAIRMSIGLCGFVPMRKVLRKQSNC